MNGTAISLLSIPCALVAGFAGGMLAAEPSDGAPVAAPQIVEVVERQEPVLDTAKVQPVSVAADAGLRERIRELEAALGELRLSARSAGGRPTASLAPAGQIEVEHVQSFLRLERSVARYKSMRGRQSQARRGVERIARDAQLDSAGHEAVQNAMGRYFEEEQRLLMVDRSELDDLGKRALETSRQHLRERTLADLGRSLDAGVARTIADQLWQGSTPGTAVRAGRHQRVRPEDFSAAARAQLQIGGGRAR